MIVRDAGQDLARCLESARGAVDEMVVADTGSRDASMRIAAECGARVVEIPWENDFARARNCALAAVTADWVLSLDADEVLDPRAAPILRRLIEGSKAGGYQVTIRNYVADPKERLWGAPARPNDGALPAAKDFPAYLEHENVRLFRRHPEIYFVGRVHESTGWRIRETGARLGKAGFVIHHFGMIADAAARARKNEFYRELGRLKLQEMPQNAQAHFELGILELDHFHCPEAASRCFERACELNPRMAMAWYCAAIAQLQIGNFAAAVERFGAADRCGYTAPEAEELCGDALYNLGRFEAAAASYRRAARRASRELRSGSKLGLALVRTGAAREGLRHLRAAIRGAPADPENHDRLIKAHIWLSQLAEAADAAEKKLTCATVEAADYLKAASICAQLKQFARAAALLREALSRYPAAASLQAALGEAEARARGDSTFSNPLVPGMLKQ
jgi:Flp pilus assembly protein TadD